MYDATATFFIYRLPLAVFATPPLPGPGGGTPDSVDGSFRGRGGLLGPTRATRGRSRRQDIPETKAEAEAEVEAGTTET